MAVNDYLFGEFSIVNYECQLVHFNLRELNLELDLVKCEIAQHWP